MAEIRVTTSLRPKHINGYPTSGTWSTGPEAIWVSVYFRDMVSGSRQPKERMIIVPEPAGRWRHRG